MFRYFSLIDQSFWKGQQLDVPEFSSAKQLFKNDVVVFGAKKERFKVCAHLHCVMLRSTDQARTLGVVMDSDLSINSLIKTKKHFWKANIKVLVLNDQT